MNLKALTLWTLVLLPINGYCASMNPDADFLRSAGDVRLAVAPALHNFNAAGRSRKISETAKNSRRDDSAGINDPSKVVDGRTLFFLDKGYVYEKDLDSGKVSRVDGIAGVAEIVLYKHALVARQNSSLVFIRYPHSSWITIGYNAKRIAATDDDLVALTGKFDFLYARYDFDGELWIYRGRPNNGYVAFDDTGLRNIERMDPAVNSAGRKDILIKFKDGKTALYSKIH